MRLRPPRQHSYVRGVLSRAVVVLTIAHTVVSIGCAVFPIDDAWADGLSVADRAVGGGVWIFVFFAFPTLVISLTAWSVLAWLVDQPRWLRAAWFVSLGVGLLAALPLATEGGVFDFGALWPPLLAQACAACATGFVLAGRTIPNPAHD
jgi:hypothetical protein